ncbi:hypothetical protein CTA2_2820 [Colletotrichum tanaceti]|uniref:Uncharacterized protein n=1 Tax=Colletotrichum tanaceti TaxID=1306861 RepID=A0A4U6X143_9PEZI|nr:hypothetical protein CTA2_2820 [Colletotrichum tanaceti]TKW49092.1 hypothetical protein CTA1_8167 [Colletotrichum tanaceti]
MNIPRLTFNPPSGDAILTPPSLRTVDRAGPKVALAAFSALELAPQPNGSMASSLSSLSIDFTTPTKTAASPQSKSTTKKQQAPKFASLSLASPFIKFSTAETPRPNKSSLSTPWNVASFGPSGARTPSPKKVSFADESFTPLSASTPKQHLSASTPKLARALSPKSSPSQPALSDFSVMSIVSPATPQILHHQSHSNQGQLETPTAPQSLSDSTYDEESSNLSSLFGPSPSRFAEQAHETGSASGSPLKADTTMHDITMLSDLTVASPRKPQGNIFISVKLSETAKNLCGPFHSESFEGIDFTSTLSPVPDFPRRTARIPRTKQNKQRRKTSGLIFEKVIAKRVVESLAIQELDAAVQFRHIAVKGKLAYALCPRKRQRVAEGCDEDYSEPYWLDEEVEERPVINMIEARRVLRNDLFALPAGPSVREQRQQYKADMEKYGEVMTSTRGKRNYDGEPKRAYNNGLLTHAIMKPLLAFPMPDLSFEWVLETAIRDSNKAHGREQPKHRNVRQPIAVFGESDFSVIEEEEEPQSPTAKLPHFPSSATYHSRASRKSRLDHGLDSLRSKIAAFAAQEPEAAPSSPLSSPIGPGFTFEVPSFISSPSIIHSSVDEAEEALDETSEAAASPIVYFKDRSQTSPFKKRKSLPAARRPSLTSLLRRASLPVALPAADSDQALAVQDLQDPASGSLVCAPDFSVELPATDSDQAPAVQDLQDPASGSLVCAPDSSVELPAVQNPFVADSASAAAVVASPSSASGASPSSALASASPMGSASPSPVVLDVRENPDIFGSFQERPGSPIQTLASLARVFEEAKETMDAKVVVSREGGRLIVRFKVSDEHVALFAAAEASDKTSEEAHAEDAIVGSITPAETAAPMSPLGQTTQEEEQKEQKEQREEESKEMEEDVLQMLEQAPTTTFDDENSDLIMLREFMSRHAARKAAKATEPTEPSKSASRTLSPVSVPGHALSPTAFPSAPIRATFAPTPERAQSIWADTPAFSVNSPAERPVSARRECSRRPLGALDVNSPSPRKAKRKGEELQDRDASPEKNAQPAKRQRRDKPGKSSNDENEKPEGEEKAKLKEDAKPSGDDGPVAGVRTRAQRAAERGEAPPVTKIPVRHQRYAKVRGGDGEKDVTVVTRQNTRANKGSAMSADEMLEYLKTVPAAEETGGAVVAARKDGKSVQWAEQLATSQAEEHLLVPLSPAEEKQVGKARGRPKASSSKTASSTKVSTKTTTKTSNGNPSSTAAASKLTKSRQAGIPGPKTDGAKVSKPKKVTAAAKKELGLSANGTPAKRSARIAQK